MSGQPKQGLDWAGWSVRIFEDDERIDELIDAQGWTGFSIYFFLCQKAYATNGYFYRWNYTNSATTARKMGGGIKSETVKQVVSLCLRIGLFDKKLFDRESILTNKEIQERFSIAVEKRSENGRTVDPKYWLLNPQETKAYIIIPKNNNPLPENAHNLPENTTKKSKVNKSKEKQSKCVLRLPATDGVFILTNEEYHRLKSEHTRTNVDKSLEKLKLYLQSNPSKQRTVKATGAYVEMWIKRDNERLKEIEQLNSQGRSYNLEEYENSSIFDD